MEWKQDKNKRGGKWQNLKRWDNIRSSSLRSLEDNKRTSFFFTQISNECGANKMYEEIKE